MTKKIMLMGATGSIGTQTLEVIAAHANLFELVGFSYGQNIDKAREIIKAFSPKIVVSAQESDQQQLAAEFPDMTNLFGEDGLIELVRTEDYDILFNAIVGSVGLLPTVEAINLGHDVALANKEAMVVAGYNIMTDAARTGSKILPVDSEHSAIFQVLQGVACQDDVRSLTITASGGSFRDKKREELVDVTLAEALAHPNWSMGAKITLDSATMVNKGLEVIEAHHLFGVPYENIHVVLHRESIVHSMITLNDGVVLAQLGASDMREPIQYALSYPKHLKMHNEKPFDLTEIGALHFEKIDLVRFPMLDLAYRVGKLGGGYPAVYNAANEVANQAFLDGKISFLEIEQLITRAVFEHMEFDGQTLNQILATDKETRQKVRQWIADLTSDKEEENNL
ncbi:1-deoxy-D-xylulose 5-phosphate reductoisomerase [Lactococcus hodotermopsidis]|uniref:1-deoxy-D-xylulose 5-phosphate reductoisomerase n=1 Tax=Pseudolactococcus hodotermopsidis TaxID=2709157 RepID=A0A6A0BAC0_9LACT|nr:1-deoxy-D-xylulose-5-phosphate reductoisomerase [Lactococcus hodotermopsidis]GFH41583.1 1-deoxy-D-xylulose 5-phosphate reductoisomerase [Lactococcus hodotermopsidis]